LIDFSLSEDQRLIKDLARRFAREIIAPLAAEYDEKEEVPPDIVGRAHQAGMINLDVPAEYGGQGLDHLTSALVTEELARGCAGIATLLGANSLGMTPILLAGSEEQKQRLLTPVCSRPQLAAYCLTEPGAGSDTGAITTVAREVDGGGYILNGQKCFITNGGIAALYTVVASTDPNRGQRGLSVFAVPGDAPGVSSGKKERKLGIRASHTAEVVFEDVFVPAENLIGRRNQGFKITMNTLDISRPGVGAMAVGVAQAALDVAVDYAGKRVQFGKRIAAFQGVQFMLADMAAAVEAARLLVYKAAWLLDQGAPMTLAASLAKFVAGDAAVKVATDAVQILGGYGYMRDYPAEKLLRDAKIMQIYEGTNQIQRMVAARAMLKS